LIALIILKITLEIPKVFETYDANFLLQDAVERNIITIGEAMKALLKLNPQIGITNSRKVVDARNKLTHGYDESKIFRFGILS
jgi:uncharacterized protein with HEPN domain